MRITLIVASAAVALAAGLGSASAADQFTTMNGVLGKVAPMAAAELETVRGAWGLPSQAMGNAFGHTKRDPAEHPPGLAKRDPNPGIPPGRVGK